MCDVCWIFYVNFCCECNVISKWYETCSFEYWRWFHFCCIRAAHYGELAPECVRSYYKYGCALLYKAQEESDPLVSGTVSKKESTEKGSTKSAESGETSVSSKTKEGTSNLHNSHQWY